jgi:hypothetical protein
MFINWMREREIREVLRGLARQRIAVVHQPGGIQVIEKALKRGDTTEAALATCHMRGWVEVMHDEMPVGDIDPDNLPNHLPPFTRTETIYRLTEGGWAALNRAHFGRS